MTGARFSQVGIDRLVRLDWLERVASLALAGNDTKAVKGVLQHDLKQLFRSERTDVRGSLDKTITILLKVWVTTPPLLESLRTEGLELLKYLPQQDKLAVHWGMVMAVYPFWSSVAMQVGRLLRLQGTVTAAHVQRRVREQYGERETVSRRTRYVLRSYLDWGVLQESGTKGIYACGRVLFIEDPRLITWLTEAVLHARANGAAPLKALLDSPSVFPFRFKPIQAASISAASPRLDIIRHGLDDNLIIFKK
ncbi:MAG: hypothetical protein DDT21_02050 [Syntrophomonadaceae bacterium]|nr:hypothetical protein [Bacillota bacterium]